MDLAALRTELQARGGARLEVGTNTRTDAYLNRAYLDICEDEEWPFLAATASGTAPLTISDLRTVESAVIGSLSLKLSPRDPRDLLEDDTSLTTTGTPTWYYVTSTGISVYPTSTTASLSVRYWKVPALLSNGTDTPLLPARFHQLIIDQAMQYVYLDADGFDQAAALQPLIDVQKARMRKALLHPSHDRPARYIENVVAHLDMV